MSDRAMERHWHFTDRDFFYGLSNEKADFISLSALRITKKNQLIFSEDERGDSAFYLEEGKVRIFRISQIGKESIVFIRHAGEMFGLAEVIGDHKRLCSAQAMTRCRLYEIKMKEFDLLLQRHYSLARRVMEVLGKRLRYLGEQIENFMVCDVVSRLLKLLIYLSCHDSIDLSSLDKPLTVPVRLTQEQIAAMIGSCQQTVSEALKKLKQDGIIRISRKEITLLKPREIADHILT